MKSIDRQSKFQELRDKYPWFVYQSYTFRFKNGMLQLKFNFNLADKYLFEPELEIPARHFYDWEAIPIPQLENLIFHIGMIELISYWKCSCAPKIIVKPFNLTAEQITFWKKLYFHGLGEFFYLNGLNPSQHDFVTINSDSERELEMLDRQLDAKVLVPVGGGKDSVVSLELLRTTHKVIPFIINPRPASIRCAAVAGFEAQQTAVVNRKLDPLLLQLNEEGFLNGHTPFSALLAFVSLLTAAGAGLRYIALSNESSANEPTVPGTEINHQYSKSIDFERDFSAYVGRYIHRELSYFSFLRPLNELQIAQLFSRFEAYHPVFRSCNAGSKTDSWCGKCSKCLFTWIILSPFIKHQKLLQLFGKNLLEDAALHPILDELSGRSVIKPFECVGTLDEVNAALGDLKIKSPFDDMPLLLKKYQITDRAISSEKSALEEQLTAWQETHFLPESFSELLNRALYD
ncbi:MAG: hypothetical protein PF694_02810 [Bacteroidetes bacterium]|nr:hypothetical protein [Bacteroidota bacterium]